jgi:hypothetical protein
MSGGQWIRLMMDSIDSTDDLAHAVYAAGDAVNQLSKSSPRS